MLVNKETRENTITSVDKLPDILALNAGGEPLGWISYEKSAFYAAKDKIQWSIGEYEVVLRGGTNAATGERSILTLDTIIALKNGTSPTRYRRSTPGLTNPDLFARDMCVCAYCIKKFSASKLTRDHIVPRSKGGPDIWTNVVAACRRCNQHKNDRTPDQAGMKLAYVPYAPTYSETLILRNRRILADQMEFLMKGVSKGSRLHPEIAEQVLVLQ